MSQAIVHQVLFAIGDRYVRVMGLYGGATDPKYSFTARERNIWVSPEQEQLARDKQKFWAFEFALSHLSLPKHAHPDPDPASKVTVRAYDITALTNEVVPALIRTLQERQQFAQFLK